MKDINRLLNRPEILKQKIIQCKYEIDGLRDQLMPGSMEYGKIKVQFTPSDKLPEIEARIDELERKIRHLKKEKAKAINNIKKVAMKLPELQKTVIIGLYVSNRTVKEIADEMNYSISSIYYIKKNAIKSMKKNRD